MELVTGAMGSLLPKLAELLKDEYGLQTDVKKKIDSLSRELWEVHALLRKIGDVPWDQLDEQVRLWASELREASYDMEDIVDTFLVHVDEPTDRDMLRRLRKKVRGFFKKSKARRKISSQIQDINEKLKEVATGRVRYRLDSIVANPVDANIIDPRILNLYKKTTELVGIEGPRDELINMLSPWKRDDVSINKKMKIVSIVGFGGLGKTTLAKAVYDHFKGLSQIQGNSEGLRPHGIGMKQIRPRPRPPRPRPPRPRPRRLYLSIAGRYQETNDYFIRDIVSGDSSIRFEYRAFVPVGQNPDIKKVFRDILIDLDRKQYTEFMEGIHHELDLKQLMDLLKEFVEGKSCLIVIDDIWDKKILEFVRCALEESSCRSRLVITTRKFDVAKYADEAYKIQPLSHDNSKKLLYARIVDGEANYFDSPRDEACEKILKKCGGVPLAIITIASLLASKPREDWSKVYNSIGFGQEDNDDVTNTRRILSFSYYDLPSHLKACLLYLGVFPEDHVIEKNSLIWKWIAEGFISKEHAAGRVGLFELGERYFNELINRNMIQAQETKYEGYVDACSVHDMVLDLIHQLSSEQNFVTVLNGGEGHKPQGSIPRRLSLQCVKEHNVSQLANVAVEKVRSVFASQCDFCALCPRLPVLRVVETVQCSVLEGCSEDLSEDYLRSLLHLRYLQLESTTVRLPSEVRYLRFLQTLDVRRTGIKQLPEEVGFLTQLVCLRADRGTRVPADLIGKLTSLQELCIWCEGEGDATMKFVEELGLLRQLRVLKTWILVKPGSIESVLLESLGHLHNIQELHILGTCTSKVGVSDAGSVSCRHLHFLRLENLVFSGLPAWIKSSLAHLSYLDLEVIVVKDQDLQTLAKLPELSCLILHLSDTKLVVSIKICTDEGVAYFRKLRFLKILGPSIWFDLHGSECNSSGSSRVASNTIMPSLESLEFAVHVRSLKDENLHLGFDKLLGFQNLGRNSLQRVSAGVNCENACIWEVKEAEAALKRAAEVHPKHPTLRTIRVQPQDIISRYQEACAEMSRAPELVTKAWKLLDIVGSRHIQILRLPDPTPSSSKVIRLLYTDNGVALLALNSYAVHKLWKWKRSDKNPWQQENDILMTNDTTNRNPEEAIACSALYGDDEYLFSASGGKVSWFDMKTFKVVTTFMAPPPAATFLAFDHRYSDIIAIGMEDSSIHIYNVVICEVQNVLIGHQKKITGLAFSKSKKVLVSSGADAQLCVWSIDGWEKKTSRYIQPPSNLSSALVGDTMVQFHYNQRDLLVFHESQLAIYDWQLECLCSWFPRDALPAPISSAVYSLGCLLVYAGFRDGAIGIFEAESLTFQCRIAPSAYIPSSISSSGETAYPTVVATHPWKPNQIAVGMSDGAVLVLEPLDTDDVQVGSNASSEQCLPSDVSNSGGHCQVLDV